MHRPRVLLYVPAGNGLPGLEERQIVRLRAAVPAVDWIPCRDEAMFLQELPRARAAAVWRFREEWLESAWRLALVSTPAAGREWVAVRDRPGLAVRFGTFHGELIAETLLGLILAFDRGIKDSLDRRTRGEAWPREEVSGGLRTLRGSRVAILGFGHIGKWIGRVLKPLGARLVGVNRRDMTRPDYFGEEDRVVGLNGLDAVLPQTDHLVLALPGGPDTDALVDARRLALLPREACVHNVGRGNAIDMPALAGALERGELRGAGLDVYPEEPLPEDAPIRRAPGAILLPHVSAFAPRYMDLYAGELVGQVRERIPEAAAGST